MNRGKFHAQGGGTNKSSLWQTNNTVTKKMGYKLLNILVSNLTPTELSLRRGAVVKVSLFIKRSTGQGVPAVLKKSFYDDKQNRKIRIDIDIFEGWAFS